jgi:DNA-binding HxlR family transcriptional regulator
MPGPAQAIVNRAGPARETSSLDMTDPPPSASSAGGSAAGADAGPAGEAADTVCPYFHQAVELVGKRWTGAVVGVLLPGPRRFCELSQAIPQISDRLLSTRLRELESEGLVERRVLAGSPVRVSYALTDKGRALEPAIAELQMWAHHWIRPSSDSAPLRR